MNTPNNDYLGYGVYADSLWARIKSALDKPQGLDDQGKPKPLGDDPLVVGIFGEWGAGKSKLLSLIQDRAKEHLAKQQSARVEQDTGFSLTIPVFFQPWKYEHEKHLHMPLLMHILDAYVQSFQDAQTLGESATTEVKAWAAKAKPILGWGWRRVLRPAAEAFAGQFSIKLKLAPEIEELANDLREHLRKERVRQQKEAAPIKVSSDGLYFYRWHQTLQQLTRPALFPQWLTDDDKKILSVDSNPKINFVIFIDDLDRCLPENAVGTLELIKTIFNVESFAFVLALDEEVIERGIGHRYQAYNFAGKKPEMPITGFEYLEKIVHLPFRLPALTNSEAVSFLHAIEDQALAEIKAQNDASTFKITTLGPWFKPLQGLSAQKINLTSDDASQKQSVNLDLSHFALYCFKAYVPRKLTRLIELFYQVEKIAFKRGTERALTQKLGYETDVRIVLSFLLLQLFQPELYRVFKRTGEGFGELLKAFQGKSTDKGPDLVQPVSDMDLLRWACLGKSDDLPPTTIKSALYKIGQLSANDPGERHKALQVRLPVVACLLEHRQAQRHAFDPLKLFELLAKLCDKVPLLGNALTALDAQRYFSLLSAHATVGQQTITHGSSQSVTQVVNKDFPKPHPVSVDSNADKRPQFKPLADSQGLYQLLITSGSEPRAIEQAIGLALGEKITPTSSRELLSMLERWLLRAVAGKPKGETSNQVQEFTERLLVNLQYLAPYLAIENRADFWGLVEDLNAGDVLIPTAINALTPNPKLAALYADVRSLLGQDKRFDPTRFYLLRDRFKEDNNTNQDEPIAGFVRVEGGKFIMGYAADKGDNQPREIDLGTAPFYMARTLTTVDQYAAFMADGGYDPSKNAAWWDKQGLNWVQGRLDSEINNEYHKRHFAQRKVEDRLKPWDWDEQQAFGSRPVRGVTWFEARAYARWLNAQLLDELKEKNLNAYEVCLPTEAYWERAARQAGLQANTNKASQPLIHKNWWNWWPWGDDEATVKMHANIGNDIGQVSTVGCYAPNPLGLLDMVGNVWEWQDNLYPLGLVDMTGNVLKWQEQDNLYTLKAKMFVRITKNQELKSEDDEKDSDFVALRGGSWISSPVSGRCSDPRAIPLEDLHNGTGFRVMLSLAK